MYFFFHDLTLNNYDYLLLVVVVLVLLVLLLWLFYYYFFLVRFSGVAVNRVPVFLGLLLTELLLIECRLCWKNILTAHLLPRHGELSYGKMPLLFQT